MNTKTEREAAALWCPFARLYGYEGSSLNRQNGGAQRGQPLQDAHCIASKCMAWRWFEPADGQFTKETAGTGYCGLAQR